MATAKAISVERFLEELPRQDEIPRVEQAQLRRLYEKFSRGIEDKELFDEVESRLLARAEVFIDLNDLEDALRYAKNFPTEADETFSGGVMELSRSGQRIVIRDEEMEYPVDHKDVRTILGNYAMQPSDAWGDVFMVYKIMLGVRRKGFKIRMVALDGFINTTHTSEGPLADSFIESRPLSADKFLDKLSGTWDPHFGQILFRRPKPVRVKAHRRRR